MTSAYRTRIHRAHASGTNTKIKRETHQEDECACCEWRTRAQTKTQGSFTYRQANRQCKLHCGHHSFAAPGSEALAKCGLSKADKEGGVDDEIDYRGIGVIDGGKMPTFGRKQ